MKLIATLMTCAGLVGLPHVNAGDTYDPEVYSNLMAKSSYNATHIMFPGLGKESSQTKSINYINIFNSFASNLVPYANDAMQSSLRDYDPLDLEIDNEIVVGPIVFPFEVCRARATLSYYVAPIYGLSDANIDVFELTDTSIKIGFPKTKWEAKFSFVGSYPTSGINIDFGGSFYAAICGASFYQALDAYTFIEGPKVSFDLVMSGYIKAYRSKAKMNDVKAENSLASHKGVYVFSRSGFDEGESAQLREDMRVAVDTEYTSSEVEMENGIEDAVNNKIRGMSFELKL